MTYSVIFERPGSELTASYAGSVAGLLTPIRRHARPKGPAIGGGASPFFDRTSDHKLAGGRGPPFVQQEESDLLRRGDDYSMRVPSKRTLLQKVGRCLIPFGAIAVLTGAHAENLDQGKSGPKLFADSCVTCHRSARGLAKGRFSLTLYLFLQQHYVSNSSAAWELTSYLESVDSVSRDRRAAAAKPSPRVTRASGSSLRPPMPVPGR